MKRKAVSGITLALFLIGMLTLAFNICGVLADGSWNIETVDSTGYVGGYASIALDSGDNPHISYWDSTNGDLKYAYYEVPPTPPVGGVWLPLDKLALLAPYIGLATLLAVVVVTVGYVKKRKRNPESIS